MKYRQKITLLVFTYTLNQTIRFQCHSLIEVNANDTDMSQCVYITPNIVQFMHWAALLAVREMGHSKTV